MPNNHHNSFHPNSLREQLAPFRLHFFTSLRSTNDHAAALRRRGELFAPAIILASRQTAGRGRGSNTWFSAEGSLTVTFVLAADPMLAAHHVPLAAGLAVRNAVAALTLNPQVGLKWPNDLVIPATSGARPPLKKLAGLLCERLDNVDLIGLGLNVNRPPKVPRELQDRAQWMSGIRESAEESAVGSRQSAVEDPSEPGTRNSALQSATGSPFDLSTVLISIAREIHQVLIRKTQTPFGLLLREYDQYHALLGRMLTVFVPHETPVTGRCEGLDDTGRLLVKVGRRTIPIIAGHVELKS